MATKKERIQAAATELLAKEPSGLRFSELVAKLQETFPDAPYGTITGNVWNLDALLPAEIYKPSRGVFRLTSFRVDVVVPPLPEPPEPPTNGTPRESDFYEPFAEYLVAGLEECTKAIPLGGNRFGSKWGTPDVFGIFRSRESDIVKMPIEVIAAEIKTDTGQLITAFGQACAYKLFAHRSYLVVPKGSQPEDIGRLDALCVIFGIGLILFDATNPRKPDFEIRVRASKHEPDSFYVNQNVRLIADALGL